MNEIIVTILERLKLKLPFRNEKSDYILMHDKDSGEVSAVPVDAVLAKVNDRVNALVYPDGFTKTTPINRVGNTVSIAPYDFAWRIDLNPYSNAVEFEKELDPTTSPVLKRIDTLAATKQGTIVYYKGVEDEFIIRAPDIRTDELRITDLTIFGDEVQDHTEPIVTEIFTREEKEKLASLGPIDESNLVHKTGDEEIDGLKKLLKALTIRGDGHDSVISTREVDGNTITSLSVKKPDGELTRIFQFGVDPSTNDYYNIWAGDIEPNNENYMFQSSKDGSTVVLSATQRFLIGINNSFIPVQATNRGLAVGYEFAEELPEGVVLGVRGNVVADEATSPEHLVPLGQMETGLDLKLDKADYNDRFKGKYTSLTDLQAAFPTANTGDSAQVDEGEGFNVITYNWDSEEGWVVGSSSGSGANNTDELLEGSSNLYFKTARVLATALTGLSFLTGGSIVSTDSVLVAFGKVQKQINDLSTALSNVFPTVSSGEKVVTVTSTGAKAIYDIIDPFTGTTSVATLDAADWSTGSVTANGVAGERRFGNTYEYVCTGTNNWRRNINYGMIVRDFVIGNLDDSSGVKTSSQMVTTYPNAVSPQMVIGINGMYQYFGIRGWFYFENKIAV